MSETTGPLPQSPALAEAKAPSISEYMSLDPENLTQEQELRIIENLREQRRRFEEAEKAGKKPPRQGTEKRPAKAILQSLANVEDLDGI